MIKCKVCGAANSLDSSVCAECGAALRASRKNNSTDSEKEIFSNTRTEELTKSGEQRIDLFSSGEKYERMRKGAVLEKIYKQEQAMGEVTELEEPPEPEEVKPIVISRQSSSDIVGKKKKSSKKSSGKGKTSSKNYKIPQRVIEPVDSQLLGHKTKPQTANTPEDENVKVELKASDPVGDIRKKNKNSSNRPKDIDNKKKQNSQSDSKPKQQKKDSNPEKQNGRNKNVKNTVRPENSQNKKAASETSAKGNPENNVSKKNAAPKKTAAKDNGNSQKAVRTADGNPEQTVKEQCKAKKASPKKAAEVLESAAASEAKATKSVNKSTAKSSVKAVTDGDKPKKTKSENSSGKAVKKGIEAEMSKQKNKSGTVNGEVKKIKKQKPHPAAAEVEKTAGKTESTSSLKSRTLVREFTESDIDSNKNFAALAYIGILFLIPLAKSGKSNFCRVHTKQGIAVFIYSCIIKLLTLTAVIGLRVLLLWKLGLSYRIYNISAAAVAILMIVLLLVPVFSGALSAFSGVYKAVPFVGKFVKKNSRR